MVISYIQFMQSHHFEQPKKRYDSKQKGKLKQKCAPIGILMFLHDMADWVPMYQIKEFSKNKNLCHTGTVRWSLYKLKKEGLIEKKVLILSNKKVVFYRFFNSGLDLPGYSALRDLQDDRI